jgi:hypothetical protein
VTAARPTRALPAGLLAAAAAGALACTGAIDRAPGGGPSGGADPGGPPPGGAGPGAGGPMVMGPVPPDPVVAGAPATGQRLTDRQYLNVVMDLLGVDASAQAAALPLDPKLEGFRNAGAALLPSDLRIEVYAGMAAHIAGQVDWSAHAARLGACATMDEACARGFVAALGRRLFRRPLADEEVARFLPIFPAVAREGDGFPVAAALTARAMLQSPEFLYRLEPGRADGYAAASRLAFLLWNSAPDDPLLDAAGRGAQAVRAQVARLLDDPRARRALRDYVDDWLDVDKLPRTRRDPERFPQFDAALATRMRDDVHRLFERVVFDEDGDLVEVVRQGLLTQPGILTVTSVGAAGSSIVDRGVFLLRNLLCKHMPEPPNNVPELPPASASASERDRLAQHRADPACGVCHNDIDPLGLPFETYDAIGGYQARDEAGNALTGAGEIEIAGQRIRYANTAEFVTVLARHPGLDACLVQKVVQYTFARPLAGEDQPLVDQLGARFRQQGGRYRALLQEVADRALLPPEVRP